MFQDEARFGRISDVRHCWDKQSHRPIVRALLTQQYTFTDVAFRPLDGRCRLAQKPGHEIGREYANLVSATLLARTQPTGTITIIGEQSVRFDELVFQFTQSFEHRCDALLVFGFCSQVGGVDMIPLKGSSTCQQQ